MASWNLEHTDTFCGESNYTWVRRATIETKTDTDHAAVCAAKRYLGWQGMRCRVERYGDTIAIYPQGLCQVCFLTWPEV